MESSGLPKQVPHGEIYALPSAKRVDQRLDNAMGAVVYFPTLYASNLYFATGYGYSHNTTARCVGTRQAAA
jgi:hypothetical protein